MAEENDTTHVASPQVSETRLETHPLALIFPEVTGTDFDDLVADIKAHGLVEEIVTHEGKILDGRTRYKACMAAGVEPRYRPFERVIEFDGGPLDYVVSKNLTRRHLTTSQRAAIAADLETRGHGGKRAAGQDRNSDLEPTRAEIAKTMNVSTDSIAVAQKVKKASPELHEEIRAGKTSLNRAEKIVERSKQAAKDPAAEPVLEGEILTGEIATPYTSKDGSFMYVGEPETGNAGLHRQITEMRADESAAPTSEDGDHGRPAAERLPPALQAAIDMQRSREEVVKSAVKAAMAQSIENVKAQLKAEGWKPPEPALDSDRAIAVIRTLEFFGDLETPNDVRTELATAVSTSTRKALVRRAIEIILAELDRKLH